ncbi:MAG: hypothetical protein KatS3mg115_0266 [Candidatus Poribacteria bacterium]|nr:MAG: hypothetical protein KatS3mg115_0266 [Candidatus Poribacteria bacterium]
MLGSWRRLGRRRRRLYLTLLILLVVGLGGATVILLLARREPAPYRPGEELPEVTRRLERGIPEEAPSPRLVEVAAEAGLGGFRAFRGERTSQLPEDMGGGAAWGDFDNDGDDDLFLVSAGGPLTASPQDRASSLLYENLGDGTFREYPGFPELRIVGMGAAWGDYNGDGRLDLAVSGYNTLRLYRNEGDRFVREERFPEPKGFWAGVSWGDFDNDLDLDLYVCGYVRYREETGSTRVSQQYGTAVPFTLNPASYPPERNLLFRNEGKGVFQEVAEALGVHNPEGRSLEALWYDFDDDGWLDLYVANDISDNAFYRNRGDGSFEDLSHPAWVADYRGAMGLAAGDWDRDGDDDLFISHWVAQENALYNSLLVEGRTRGEPGIRFMDMASAVGLGQIALQRVGWGASFVDLDSDGWLDLVVANGSTFETKEPPKRLVPQPSFLFWNERGRFFHDLAPLNEQLAEPHVSRGLAVSDYDDDGDVDLLFVDLDGGVRLFRNEMPQGNWVKVRLRSRLAPSGEPIGWGDGAKLIARVGRGDAPPSRFERLLSLSGQPDDPLWARRCWRDRNA